MLALPATKEYYTFIASEETDIFNKLGPFAWLATAVAVAETLVCIKFGRGMFPKPWPSSVLLAWGTAGLVFAVFMGGVGRALPQGAPPARSRAETDLGL